MSIFESLENLNVSEECFDSILDIVEELLLELNESNYSAADVANRARKVLPDRKKAYTQAKKSGDFSNELFAKERYEHAKALASLPKTKKSGISAKTLDKAAYNSAQKRQQDFEDDNNAKEGSLKAKRSDRATDMVRSYADRSYQAISGNGLNYEEAGKRVVPKPKQENSEEYDHLLREIFRKNK